MDVSVIIVNYNTFDLTRSCIASIYRNTNGLAFEIILVDNGSTEKPPEKFKEIFPDIILIANRENKGFGVANNQGMKAASGKYFLLLNSDTEILKDNIQSCFRFMESDSTRSANIGLVGCRLLNPDLTHQPSIFPYLKNNLWIYAITSNLLFFKILQLLKMDRHTNFNPSQLQEVGDVSGAYMFLRKEIAERSGYFDADFFMYCEDTEWCRERISKLTHIYFYPTAEIIHHGGQSAPKKLMFVQSKLSLSLLWYKKGWLNYFGYIMLTFVNTLTCVLLYPFLKSSGKDLARQYVHGYSQMIPYLFWDIPRYSRKPNSRRQKLIFTKARPAME